MKFSLPAACCQQSQAEKSTVLGSQTLINMVAMVMHRRPASMLSGAVLRRPASSSGQGHTVATRPHRRRSSCAGSAGGPEGSGSSQPVSEQFFDFSAFVRQVQLGQAALHEAPTCKLAIRAARRLGKKIRCHVHLGECPLSELNFRQWSSNIWTANCNRCEAGEWVR